MQVSKLTHKYLDKWHDKKNYVAQNKFVVCITIFNLVCILLLLTGNLSLNGLKLTGPIKSTAHHKHCTYDNDFIVGTYMQDGVELVEGSAIRAKDIRAVRSSISAYYMMSEGVLYIHGPIMFAESVEYPFKKDKDGNFLLDKDGEKIIDILGVPQFHSSGTVGLYPDYNNNCVTISGFKFTEVQLKQLAKDIKPLLEGEVICGND